MLPVSSNFLAAQNADVNVPAAKVQLVLGDYCNSTIYGSTVSANSTDTSGNFPASGAINGDHTELNIGAAATADNGVGKSSWASAAVPTSGSPCALSVTFTQSRTINRIKLYHRSNHGMASYRLFYWNGSSLIAFAQTSDLTPAAGVVQVVTTHELDVIDFPDVSTTAIQLNVYAPFVGGDSAQVVEIEAYRKVDITARCKSIKVSRQRDYKIANPMAATVELDVINNDRFFSISHIPTAAEIAAGFVNTELVTNIGILVSWGWNYPNAAPELVSGFVGKVDRITIRPKTRDAVISGRDTFKTLINRIDSANLKTDIDVADCVLYVLNRAGISTWETNISETGIQIPYFFTDAEAPIDTIRDLAQAAVSAIFYFDENGIAIFKNFLGSIPQQFTWSSNADWDAGTKTNIDDTSTPDQMQITMPEQTDNFSSLSGSWVNDGNMIWAVSGSTLHPTSFSSPIASYIMRPDTGALRFWQFTYQFPSSFSSHIFQGGFVFMAGSLNLAQPRSAYRLRIDAVPGSGSATISLEILSSSGGFTSTLASFSYTEDSNAHTIKIVRTYNGGITITRDGTPIISVTDLTYTTGNYCGFYSQTNAQPFQIIQYSSLSFTPNSPQTGNWLSAALDTGTDTTSYGALQSTIIAQGGNVTFFTQSSDDNVTYDAFVPVSLGGQISSTVRRYLKVSVDLDSLYGVVGDPQVLDITVNWFVGTGSPLYPPGSSFTTAFNSTLLDIQQELADDLGGDTAILNDVIVQAQPIILTGADTDVLWQGTVGVPPVAISGSTPLTVTQNIVITTGANDAIDLFVYATGNTYSVTIPGGSYTESGLAAEIVSLLNGLGIGTITSWGCSFTSGVCDIYQTGPAASNYKLLWGTGPHASTSAAIALGFVNSDAGPSSNSGPNLYDIFSPNAPTVGKIIVIPYISGGMDISRMSGSNPSALAVTFASGAAGSWVCTQINPTLPIFEITITNPGTITNLQLQGKTFENSSYIQAQEAQDAASIQKNDNRQDSISNQWITNAPQALLLAQTLVDQSSEPVSYLPACQTRPNFAVQLGDRFTVIDTNLDLSGDYINVGTDQEFTVTDKKVNIVTTLKALKVPAGF